MDSYCNYMLLAENYMNKKEYLIALNLFEKSTKFKRTKLDAEINIGICYFFLKDYVKASATFSNILETYPDNTIAYINKGNTLKKLKKYEEALIHYDKAIELEPFSNNASDAYNNKGIIYHELNNCEKSIFSYKKALEINNKNHNAHNNLGNIYMDNGKYYDAYICYNKSLEIMPNDLLVIRNKAIMLFKCQKYKDAEYYFQKILLVNKNDTKSLDYLNKIKCVN